MAFRQKISARGYQQQLGSGTVRGNQTAAAAQYGSSSTNRPNTSYTKPKYNVQPLRDSWSAYRVSDRSLDIDDDIVYRSKLRDLEMLDDINYAMKRMILTPVPDLYSSKCTAADNFNKFKPSSNTGR